MILDYEWSNIKYVHSTKVNVFPVFFDLVPGVIFWLSIYSEVRNHFECGNFGVRRCWSHLANQFCNENEVSGCVLRKICCGPGELYRIWRTGPENILKGRAGLTYGIDQIPHHGL